MDKRPRSGQGSMGKACRGQAHLSSKGQSRPLTPKGHQATVSTIQLTAPGAGPLLTTGP